MPRIPEPELERLKKEVSLLRLIEGQGYELEKRGKDWALRCVFHEEATASLVVSPGKNLYHCFGCGAGGTVIDWVMKTQGVSLPHAVQMLQNGAPLDSAHATRTGVTRSYRRHLPSLAAEPDDTAGNATADPHQLHAVLSYYYATLKQSTEALAWLAGRGLDSAELIEHFQLGYANKTLTYRLAPGHTQGGRAERARLQASGILRASGHEHFNGCLIVPVIGLPDGANPAHAGHVMQCYGRRMNPKLGNAARHLYLPQPLAGVWNEAALIADKDVILCEALIDAMTFWCAGYRNVIAAYGVNGFTFDHWQALKHHGTRRVWIAYDRDEAGERAAAELATQLIEAGIEAWRVLFPKGMDANDYASKVKPADKSLGLMLRQAQWLGKGKGPAVAVAEVAASVAELPNEPSIAALTAENAPASPAPETASSLAAAPQAQEQEPAAKEEPATPIPTSTAAPTEPATGGELVLTFGPRVWRIKGWQKNLAPEVMKVNLQVRQGEVWHIDTFDLYAAKARAHYLKQAVIELGAGEDPLKRELGQVLLKLEQMQDAAIAAALAPRDAAPTVAPEDTAAALAWLKSPKLIERLQTDLAALGVVGEADNLLAAYLAAVSRQLDAPLALLIQSASAAGKSALMDAVLNLIPEEQRLRYSAMTGQSLYYLGETNLQHKILAIAEEEGVRQAAYALKLLQSDGELTIASTGKDEASGELTTRQYTVKGPVMLMLTTTAIDIDEELLNRCLVLSIDESREQTEAIHARQRQAQTLEGLLARQSKTALTALHHNIQRQIRPMPIVNPYAAQLTFLADKTRTRRDHMKYLTLIQSITLLHQHQRPVQRMSHRGQMLEYLETSKEDIALANRLAHRILGRTLDDMPPQTRRLLQLIHAWVGERAGREAIKPAEVRFTRRDIRQATGWSDSQLKLHCARLADMEYLLLHGGGRGSLMRYELLYDGQEPGEKRLCGLIEPQALDNEAKQSGLNGEKSGSSLAQVGGMSGLLKTRKTRMDTSVSGEVVEVAANAVISAQKNSSLAARVGER
ncbi:MAG: toprim domain-containing protein [Pseudomonadales bacterium]|jgi:DNA primase catalytic core|nr:toprim domain-containing protein [Pseudomonadales bacterium]